MLLCCSEIRTLVVQEARGVSDPGQREQLLAEGCETADFIRSSIVQAAANERGAFGEARR